MIDNVSVHNLNIKDFEDENGRCTTWQFNLRKFAVIVEFHTNKEGNKIYVNGQLKLYDPK